MKKTYLIFLSTFIFVICFSCMCFSQKKVAITIDDLPNTDKNRKYSNSFLLNKLDSLDIPTAIFVRIGLINKFENTDINYEYLNDWIKSKNTTIGYHSVKHLKYSEISLDNFIVDFEQGDSLLKNIAQKYNKTIKYFRFPFNDLGKDSIQHLEVEKYITSKNYILTPFTVESEDWMFNYIYEYYLGNKNIQKANEIAELYIAKTLEYFDFFDSLALKKYGRSISQIYLCHDNTLNADYLPNLLNELKKKKYTFISLDEAMQDEVYLQKTKYYKKWGISWLYRWMNNQKEISFFTKQEPVDETYKLYNKLINEQKNKTNNNN